LKQWQVKYLKNSTLFWRIIAIGITLPFLILPFFTAALSATLSLREGSLFSPLGMLGLVAALLCLSAALYMRWSLVPVPAKVRRAPRGGNPRTRGNRLQR